MVSTAVSFVYLNGKVLRRNEEKTIGALLREWPKGAYTSLRVENLNTVLDWPLHVKRLNQSVQLLANRQPGVYPRLQRLEINQRKMEAVYSMNLHEAIADVKNWVSPSASAITNQTAIMLITDPSDQTQEQVCDVFTYVIHREGTPNTETIKIWIQGKGRETPEAKFSKWVTDRAPLEASKPQDCQEVVLHDDSGGLLEGLTSNFYIIKTMDNDLVLQTAPIESGILQGTFRKVLLETMNTSFPEIKVDESCPNLSEISSWKEAFISNSITGIRPISEIVLPDGKTSVKFEPVPGQSTNQFIQMTKTHHLRTAISELV